MKKILIAEDEDLLRMLIIDSLEDEGHEIVEAENGLIAYEAFLEQSFDLIIVDYMMPKMNGLEVIKKVRQHPDNGEVPILMLTAKAQQQDIEEAKHAGANAFLPKPFSPLKLIEVTGDLLDV